MRIGDRVFSEDSRSDGTDEDDPGYREQLFEMCIHLGWPPIDLPDRPFAAQYKEWLTRQCHLRQSVEATPFSLLPYPLSVAPTSP